MHQFQVDTIIHNEIGAVFNNYGLTPGKTAYLLFFRTSPSNINYCHVTQVRHLLYDFFICADLIDPEWGGGAFFWCPPGKKVSLILSITVDYTYRRSGLID
jgi:hypothetical protein